MNIKSIFAGLIVLSLMTVNIVSAGNLSPGTSDTRTTLLGDSATITSPVGGEKFMDNVIKVAYTKTGTGPTKYKVDDGAPVDLPDSPISVDFTPISDGKHTVSITNTAGVEVYASVTFTIDRKAPGEVTFTTPGITTDSVTWNWDVPTDTDLDDIHITVKQGSTEITPDTPIGKVTSYKATGLKSGTEYTITVRTEDDAISQST